MATKTIEITVAIANKIRILEMHQQNRKLCLKNPSKQQRNLLTSSFSNLFNSSSLLIFSISPSSTFERESPLASFEVLCFLSLPFRPIYLKLNFMK
jgi:hypothetical protein